MKKHIESLLVILFWGSMWGIIEATLGWGFHKLHINGASIFLYSFGIFCMFAAMGHTGKGSKAIFGTAMVASAIKLMDLFLPFTFRGAIHPALFILLEGLLVVGVSHFFDIKPKFEMDARRVFLETRLAVPAFVVALLLTFFIR